MPVVAVGSENARGSGKTSTARWIAARLAAAGHRVGVVAHGYRRGGPVAAVGDEGALFVADGHLVAVGSARPLVDRGVSVIVLDDGAHDDGLVHDVVIGVVDARFPTGRGPLPRGEGRRIARFDGIVVHHARPDLPYAAPGIPTVFAERRSGPWMRDGAVSAAPEGPVAAFAGIGRPADLLDTIGVPVERFRALPDHAPIPEAFARELTAWADGRPLVCTEKDAVRAPAWLRPWWRRLELVLPREVDAWLPSMS